MMPSNSAQDARSLEKEQRCIPFGDIAGGILLVIALVLGLGFRLRMYLTNRSLWLDPACLAVNLVEKNYAALFGPLDLNQAAPVGFLIVSKLVGSFFGYSELSLTFVPFLLGVLALILFLFLSIDVLGVSVATLAFVPFASCSTAIYYSGEFKQYSSDLFFSVLILFITYKILKRRFAIFWIVAFGIIGLISVWFSHTAILMLAGTGLALFLKVLKQHDSKNVAILSIIGIIILAHFTALYFLQIRPALPENIARWANSCAPVVLSKETLTWWYKTFIGYAKYPLGFNGYGAVLSSAALIWGLTSSYVIGSNRSISNLFFFPVVLLVIFSILNLYPIATGKYDIHSRVVLFTIPMAFLFLARGINGFAKLFPSQATVAVFLAVLLLYPSMSKMVRWPKFMQQEMRPLVSRLRNQYSQGDSVYVYARAVPAFRFYTRDKPIPFIKGNSVIANDLVVDLTQIMDGERLWVVVAHDYVKNNQLLRQVLESRYDSVTYKEFSGAWLLSGSQR